MNKKAILIIVGAVILLLIGLGVIFLNKSEKIYIGFYNLSTEQVEIIKKQTIPLLPEKTNLKFITLDEKKSLKSQLEEIKHSIHILFTMDGLSFYNAKDLIQTLPESVNEQYPSTFSSSWTTLIFPENETKVEIKGIPLTVELFELNLKNDVFKDFPTRTFVSMDDMENALKYASNFMKYPCSMIGSDNTTLFFLISTIIAANGKTVDTEFDGLKQEIDLHKHLPESLKQAMDTVIDWREKQWLHPEWTRLSKTDIQHFLEFNGTVISFLTTREHKAVPYTILYDYTTLPAPLPTNIKKRNIPTKLMYIAKPLPKKELTEKLATTVDTIFNHYQDAKAQTTLCSELKLAPTNSQVGELDVHLLDSRYWVSSSYIAIPTIESILYDNADDIKTFAAEIRKYIAQNGQGY